MKIAIILAISVVTQAGAAEWNKHWTVGNKPELHISAGDASVIVEVGRDREIEANLTTRGWDISDSAVRVVEHQTDNRVEIDVRVPSTHFSFGNRSIRLEVRVPRELLADVHTGDGSISLRGLRGSLRADTGDGSINAEDLDGALDAHTGDGSVHVRGRFDALRVNTQDGSVEVDVQPGSKLQTDWRVQTGDGSVQLRVPRDLNANLEMHTGDGHIRLDVPLMVFGTQNEHGVQGKLNAGGPVLLVRTGDGSITLGTL